MRGTSETIRHEALRSMRYDHAVLRGPQSKHVYGGTANPKTVQKRRAKNKVARASRRANR